MSCDHFFHWIICILCRGQFIPGVYVGGTVCSRATLTLLIEQTYSRLVNSSCNSFDITLTFVGIVVLVNERSERDTLRYVQSRFAIYIAICIYLPH